MADLSWLSQFLADPNTGGGPGQFGPNVTEQLKSLLNASNATQKAMELTNPSEAPNVPNTPDQLPIAQTMPTGVAPQPTGLDSFITAMNTPTGAAGFANLLGNLGAAIATPGTWQQRLGTSTAGMGQNVIAADRFGKVMDRLAPSTPAPVAAPNAALGSTANFQSALLTNPPQAKPFLSLNEDLRLR